MASGQWIRYEGAVLVALVGTVACSATPVEVELIASAGSEVLQHETPRVIDFFSPAWAEAALHGLPILVTNTADSAMCIVASEACFDLPDGKHSDAIEADLPISLQARPSQVALR